jgi:hypothetical protein
LPRSTVSRGGWLLLALAFAACSPEEPPVESGGSPSEAPPPGATSVPSAPAHCRARATIEPEPLTVEPDPGMGPATTVWSGDLNDDGEDDLLLRFPEGCGNYGDCPYAIYVSCDASSSSYGLVWGPAYSFDLAVDENAAPAEGWRTLIDTQRDGKEVSLRRLGFNDGRYAIVELMDG